MFEIFKVAPENRATLDTKIEPLVDAGTAAAIAAGRMMYNSGTPVCSGDHEVAFKRSVFSDPPVDSWSSIVQLPSHKNQDKDGKKMLAVVSPSAMKPTSTMGLFAPYLEKNLVAVVSPSEKKPLFTMDMFKPREETHLSNMTNDNGDSDDDFDEFEDLDNWSSDSSGNMLKLPLMNKVIDKVITDYKVLSSDSKHSNDDVSSDARSERVARRTAVLQKLMDIEYEETLKSNMKMKKGRQRSSQRIMYTL
jgi:hypothetical protein